MKRPRQSAREGSRKEKDRGWSDLWINREKKSTRSMRAAGTCRNSIADDKNGRLGAEGNAVGDKLVGRQNTDRKSAG